MKVRQLPLVVLATVTGSFVEGMETSKKASAARWLTSQLSWGTLSTRSPNGVMGLQLDPKENGSMLAVVLPFASDDKNEGRIFFYLMGETHLHGSALVLSQAAIDPNLFSIPACGDETSAADPQDPRCIKLTLQGSIHPCGSHDVAPDCKEVGWRALLEKHPSMKDWPEDHDFHVHEMIITDDLWMIAGYGGATLIPPNVYANVSSSVHNIPSGESVTPKPIPDQDKIVPKWSNHATRARWISHHSRWSTIATIANESSVFGNIRSIADGIDIFSSTGKPVFYVPDDDPLAVHMKANANRVVVSLTEASLAQRLNNEGIPCGGEEIPLCAQVALYGKAVPVSFDQKLARQFNKTHPLAPWMSQGGSHMSGSYYVLEPTKIELLDYFGGFTEVGVDDYLNCNLSSFADVESTHIISASSSHGILWMVLGFSVGWLGARYNFKSSTTEDPAIKYKSLKETADLEFEDETSINC